MFFDKFLPNKSTEPATDRGDNAVVDGLPDEQKRSVNESFRTQWAEDNADGDKFSALVLSTLDRAVGLQAGTVSKYVDGVIERNPQATTEKRQEEIDDHFLKIVTGTGAGAGGAAALPGIGFATGAVAIAAESAVFLEAAAWYILSSAKLRGVNIEDKELRRALVLMVLSGSRGTAIVDTFIGESKEGAEATQVKSPTSLATAATLTRFSAPTLQGLSGRLAKTFTKRVMGRFKWAWMSKLLPFGLGAVAGGIANRKLARVVMDNAHTQFASL